jgi:hypothetical protein
LLIAGPAKRWLDWLNLFTYNVPSSFGSLCVAPLNGQQKLVLEISAPFILFIQLMLVHMFHACVAIKSARSSSHSCSCIINRWYQWRASYSMSSYRRAYIIMFFTTYSTIAATCMNILKCTTITPWLSVVYSRAAINCDSSFYITVRPVVITLLIAIVIIAPLLFFIWTYRTRNALIGVPGDNDDMNVVHGPLVDNQTRMKWSVIVESFDRRWPAIAWHLMIIARRAALVAVTLIDLGPLQRAMIVLTSIIILLLHLIYQPYR